MNSTNNPIRIDAPCPMLLQRMTKDENGYFCSSCSKKLMDFRDRSEQEIRSAITENTCGIFYTSQIQKTKQSFKKQFLFYCLTVCSFLGFNVKPLRAETSISNTIPVKVNSEVRASYTPEKKLVASTEKPADDEKKKQRQTKRKMKKLYKKNAKTIMGCPSF